MIPPPSGVVNRRSLPDRPSMTGNQQLRKSRVEPDCSCAARGLSLPEVVPGMFIALPSLVHPGRSRPCEQINVKPPRPLLLNR